MPECLLTVGVSRQLPVGCGRRPQTRLSLSKPSPSPNTPRAAASTVKQRLLFVGREEGKLLALRQLVTAGLRPPILVFVATKERAKELHRWVWCEGARWGGLVF